MRIYSLTATFGKLEHETLTLTPGLNVIEAPNEWGKSTWCAFLVAMLYGIDTRERTKQDSLADKERYAPWSGSPMSGRMEINWNGRDITIERSTKGRSIFGKFLAYETATGLEVPELTAANCGQMLLGVEKSVFTRAGFLKLNDLPVTQDESLRRRLNALVTTGDESGASDALAQKLKDLKNQCRSNRANGLIPKAEAQRQELEDKLSQLSRLREQSRRIGERQESLADFTAKLQNHKAALDYAVASEHAQRAASARTHLDAAAARVSELEDVCAGLPNEETLNQSLYSLQKLRQQRDGLQMEAQMQPPAPEKPEAPAPFRGCTPEQAQQQAREDTQRYQTLCTAKAPKLGWLWIVGLCLMAAGGLGFLWNILVGTGVLALGVCLLAAGLVSRSRAGKENARNESKAELLLERYRPLEVSQWEAAAARYARDCQSYEEQAEAHRAELSGLKEKLEAVSAQIEKLTGGQSYLQAEQEWKNALEKHKELADALREKRRAEELLQAFTMDQSQPVKPEKPDEMTFDGAETARLLADAQQEHRALERQAGEVQGKMIALGEESALNKQLEAVQQRLTKLEDMFAALEIAQQTLTTASAELQRRFAPRISRRSQELFGRLTGERYDRLTLGEDLSVSAGAQGEDTLHPALWRSDGTVDQLYLALRLAVAEELTPDAPLILDDALVRFDDTRLASAMQILQECAENKQVILFTCQSRENTLLPN